MIFNQKKVWTSALMFCCIFDQHKCSLGEHKIVLSKDFKYFRPQTVEQLCIASVNILRISCIQYIQKQEENTVFYLPLIYGPILFSNVFIQIPSTWLWKQTEHILQEEHKQEMNWRYLAASLGKKRNYKGIDFIYLSFQAILILFGFISTFLPTECGGELQEYAPVKHVLYE